jgi:predicted nucleic acid-binding protein
MRSGRRCGGPPSVFLVDTSVLTRVRRPVVAEALEPLLSLDLRYSAMTGLELRFSASSTGEWDRFGDALGEFTREPVLADDFERADHVQRALAGAGLKGRKPADLIIAAQAERLRLIVIHYDHDFELIASVTGQAHEWIVPRGTVD